MAGPTKPTKEALAWIHSRHKEKPSHPEKEKEKAQSRGVDTRARRPAEEDAGVAETRKMIADMIAQEKANGKARQEERDEKERDKEKRRAEEQKRAKEAEKKKDQERQDRKHCTGERTAPPRAHLVTSFILPELHSHLKMFKMKILKLNLIHSAFIFSVILVPNLWLGACCRCRARVCRCFCLSPQLFARKVFSQKICRTKKNFVVR